MDKTQSSDWYAVRRGDGLWWNPDDSIRFQWAYYPALVVGRSVAEMVAAARKREQPELTYFIVNMVPLTEEPYAV